MFSRFLGARRRFGSSGAFSGFLSADAQHPDRMVADGFGYGGVGSSSSVHAQAVFIWQLLGPFGRQAQLGSGRLGFSLSRP